VLGIICSLVSAKEEKVEKTKEPTTSPSAEPTEYPTTSPTITPYPTATPTTPFPTTSPSATPTVSPISVAPSSSPTENNTLKKNVVGAVIPMITYDMLLSDEDAALPVLDNIDKFFTMFLHDVLEGNSGMYEFDYSHLDSNVIVSQFDDRRRLDTGYSVKVDGIAYYFGQAPTRESLAHSLNVYFSFWGQGDLERHLHKLGLYSATIVSIAIDEIPVILVPDDESPKHGSHPGAHIERQKDENQVPQFIVTCLYVLAGLLLVLAVFIVLCCGRKRRRQKNLENWKRDVNSESETESENRQTPPKHDDQEEQSLSGLMSVDLSLYSTNSSPALIIRSGSGENDDIDPSALVTR